MSKAQLRPELLALLQLSAPSASEIEFEGILRSLPAAFNWNYFLERAIATNLAGYLLPYPEIAEKHYPEFVYKKIKAYQQRILLHSIQLLDAVELLHQGLQEKQIKHAFLKGCSLLIKKEAHIKSRQVSDIDLLIDPNQQKEVIFILQQLGADVKTMIYKSDWHQKQQIEHAPIQAVLSSLCIDVHIRLFEADTHYQISTFELLKEVEYYPFKNAMIPLLSKNAAHLFTILHAHKHLYSGHVFKVGSVNDLYAIKWDELSELVQTWNTNKAFQEMQKFTKTWFDGAYASTFLGQTALRFLSDRPLSLPEKTIFLKRRLINVNGILLHPKHFIFDLFPSKIYLNTHFGTGNYLTAYWRRTKNLFRF
jgi:hypothetical protein